MCVHICIYITISISISVQGVEIVVFKRHSYLREEKFSWNAVGILSVL